MTAQTAIKKKIVILGVGGHGSNAYIRTLVDKEYDDCEIDLIIGSDDDGGNTRNVLNSLERQYPVDREKILPMGDLRGNLSRLLYFTGKEDLSLLMDSRMEFTGDMNAFLSGCANFCNSFNYNSECLKFVDFCQKYLDNLTDEEKLGHKHSFGNLFLSYLMIEKYKFDHDSFFGELKNLGLIPERVNFHFFSKERLVLEGGYRVRNANGEERIFKFIGESEIDKASNELDPDLYRLRNLDGSTTQPDNKIIELLSKADYAILSCGSIANSLGQFNAIYKDLIKLRVFMLMIGNIFKDLNEKPLTQIAQYVFESGVKLDFVVLNPEAYREIAAFHGIIGDYIGEGKQLQDIRAFNKSMSDYAKVTRRDGSLIMPIADISNILDSDGREKMAEYVRTQNGTENGNNEDIRDTIGNVGIKHDSKRLSIYVDFVTTMSYFLFREMNYGLELTHKIIRKTQEQLLSVPKNLDRFYDEIKLIVEIFELPAPIHERNEIFENILPTIHLLDLSNLRLELRMKYLQNEVDQEIRRS